MSEAAQATPTAQRLVTELKVSGHLMTLDTGVFCIFHAPGAVPPDARTGLPGVRITRPPGPVFRPEAVTISTFREDGWLGGWDAAALVRVARGPAQILVTVYQAQDAAGEAPRLQVLRLLDGAGSQALPAAPPAQVVASGQPAVVPGGPGAENVQPGRGAVAPAMVANADPNTAARMQPAAGPAGSGLQPRDAEIIAHVQGRGDMLARLGDWIGERGSQRWVEGFALAPKQRIAAEDIEYQAVLGRGWLSPWVEGGQFCGSRGMGLPILGLRVRLRGAAAEDYECVLQASFVDGSTCGPADDGEPCQADSLAPLEAFQVSLRPRGALSGGAGGGRAAASASAPPPAAERLEKGQRQERAAKSPAKPVRPAPQRGPSAPAKPRSGSGPARRR